MHSPVLICVNRAIHTLYLVYWFVVVIDERQNELDQRQQLESQDQRQLDEVGIEQNLPVTSYYYREWITYFIATKLKYQHQGTKEIGKDYGLHFVVMTKED